MLSLKEGLLIYFSNKIYFFIRLPFENILEKTCRFQYGNQIGPAPMVFIEKTIEVNWSVFSAFIWVDLGCVCVHVCVTNSTNVYTVKNEHPSRHVKMSSCYKWFDLYLFYPV